MNVILIEPAFPANQREFARALCVSGAQVVGVGERPWDHLDGELRSWLSGYEQIGSVTDEAQLAGAVRRVQGRLWVDRLEATVEAHVLPAAHVREACTIPGTSSRTAFLCRDKTAMKQALREAGVPCARSASAASAGEARAFAAAVGYPLIVKPRDAAGAAGTFRATDDASLEHALRASGVDAGSATNSTKGAGGAVALEEFIEGHEGFYDTLSVGGEVGYEFISHYYPNVLEAMRTRWISPQIVATNRLDRPGYDALRAMAKRVHETLGIDTGATHMEWFYGPKGLMFSEIGCRPPGVGQWDVYCAANEFDLYREWALAVTGRPLQQRPSRRYSCGMLALRPDRDGVIRGYDGAEAVWQRYGDAIVADHLPPPGTPTQGVEAGYMANAWLRVRDPDYDRLREILDDIGKTLKVRAG